MMLSSNTILSQGGRAASQTVVMVISDGKLSFKYPTADKPSCGGSASSQ